MPLFVEAAARLHKAEGRGSHRPRRADRAFLARLRPGRHRRGPGGHGRRPALRQGPPRASRPGSAADFGAAFLEKGVEPVLFDSKASPAAASPRVFREFVLPVYRDLLVPALREAGARTVPLIIGGDTTADPRGPPRDRGRPASLRRGIGPGPFRPEVPGGAAGPESERRRPARPPGRAGRDPAGVAGRLLEATAGQPGLLFGCGVVAYDCDPENVLALREARDGFSRTSAATAGSPVADVIPVARGPTRPFARTSVSTLPPRPRSSCRSPSRRPPRRPRHGPGGPAIRWERAGRCRGPGRGWLWMPGDEPGRKGVARARRVHDADGEGREPHERAGNGGQTPSPSQRDEDASRPPAGGGPPRPWTVRARRRARRLRRRCSGRRPSTAGPGGGRPRSCGKG